MVELPAHALSSFISGVVLLRPARLLWRLEACEDKLCLYVSARFLVACPKVWQCVRRFHLPVASTLNISPSANRNDCSNVPPSFVMQAQQTHEAKGAAFEGDPIQNLGKPVALMR